MIRWVAALTGSVIVISACASSMGPRPGTPAYYASQAVRPYWVGEPLDSLSTLLGPPSDTACDDLSECVAITTSDRAYRRWRMTEPNLCFLRATAETGTITGIKTDCRISASWVGRGLVASREYTSACLDESRQRGFECISPDSMVVLGIIERPSTQSLIADYARFYEVYRFATEPQRVGSLNHDDFLVAFAALAHKDTLSEPQHFALFAPASVESLWQRGGAPVDEGPLAIPQGATQLGEARILIDGHSPAVLTAVQQLPASVPTASNLILPIPTDVMEELVKAEYAEILLPSGTNFRLSEATLRNIRNLAILLDWPEWAVRFAERGAL